MSFEIQEPAEPKPLRKRPLSLDEVLETVSNIAKDPDNRDQFKALKMLASAQNAAIVLPEPLTGPEMIHRLARMMKGCGIDLCHVAYTRAFPAGRGQLTAPPVIHAEEIPPELMEQVKKIRTLKNLYRYFPEIKRGGTPPGYPTGRGLIAQQAWVQRAATRILLDREQASVDAAAAERQAEHQRIVGEAPAP